MIYSADSKGISIRGFWVTKFIPYQDILQIKKVKIWEVWIKAFDPFRTPMLCLPNGLSLDVILIELKNQRWVGLNPSDVDNFLTETTSKWKMNLKNESKHLN